MKEPRPHRQYFGETWLEPEEFCCPTGGSIDSPCLCSA